MNIIFMKLFEMSITATWLIISVLIIRMILKNMPKYFRCILWGMVGIRLILPFSFESKASLVPESEMVKPIIDNKAVVRNVDSLDKVLNIVSIVTIIWIVGIVLMLMYFIISYILLLRRVKESICYKENVWQCDYIDTPFILGIINPRIYIPSAINTEELQHVLAHEKAHLKRHDHLWKPVAFMLLTIYWFNPLIWVSYTLLCKDIELACDEKVVKCMGTYDKKMYCETLLNYSLSRKMISICPLAFGEGGVKQRVMSVLNYKKPSFWIIVVSIIACVTVGIFFMTNPVNKDTQKNNGEPVQETIIETNQSISEQEFQEIRSKIEMLQIEYENTLNFMEKYQVEFNIIREQAQKNKIEQEIIKAQDELQYYMSLIEENSNKLEKYKNAIESES